MRNFRFMALALALVVALAGIAVARSGGGADKIEPAQSTFTAAPVKDKTRTCTGSDGEYNITHATYRGESVSADPRLAGDLQIKARSVVNLTTGLGFSKGSIKIREDGSRRAKALARFSAVNTQRGKLDGFIRGHVKNTERGRARLLANFSAAFNAEGTELTGEMGSEAPVPPQNSAVLVSGRCDRGQGDEQRGSAQRGPRGEDHPGRRGGRGPKGDD
jgi:hypothetical protein